MTWTTFMRRTWRAAAALPAALLIAALPLGSAQAAPADNGTLRVGSDLTYPPYAYLKAGEPAGFDPDFMRALGAEMKMQPEFVDTRFEQLITGLKSDHFDVVASAPYITPERTREVDFLPYFTTGHSRLRPAGAAPVADKA